MKSQKEKASKGVRISLGGLKTSPFGNSASYPTPKGKVIKEIICLMKYDSWLKYHKGVICQYQKEIVKIIFLGIIT
jgi:hypothetical protein